MEISTPHSFNAYTLLFTSIGCIYTLLFASLCLHWLHIHAALCLSLPPLAAYTHCSFPLFASTGCIYMLLFTPLGPLGCHCKLLLFSLEQYHCGLIIYKIRSIHPLSMIHIRSRNRPLIPPPFKFYAVCPLSFDPDIVHLYLHFNSPIAVHLIPKSSLDLHLFTRISISYLSISVSRRIFNSSLEFTRISISRFSVVNALQWILVDASTQ